MNKIPKGIIEGLEASDLQMHPNLELIATSEPLILDEKKIYGIEVVKFLVARLSGGNYYIPQIRAISPAVKRFISNNSDIDIRRITSEIGSSVNTVNNLKTELKQEEADKNKIQLF